MPGHRDQVVKAMHEVSQVDRLHSNVLEEIAKLLPECAEAICVRIGQVATEWGADHRRNVTPLQSVPGCRARAEAPVTPHCFNICFERYEWREFLRFPW